MSTTTFIGSLGFWSFSSCETNFERLLGPYKSEINPERLVASCNNDISLVRVVGSGMSHINPARLVLLVVGKQALSLSHQFFRYLGNRSLLKRSTAWARLRGSCRNNADMARFVLWLGSQTCYFPLLYQDVWTIDPLHIRQLVFLSR